MRISKTISPMFIIVFLLIVHSLVLLLCFKWYQDFIVRMFDPAVIMLFAMAICSLATIDYGIFRSQILRKETLYFESMTDGIRVYGAFYPQTTLRWEDISAYGTICERPGCMVLFFSTSSGEQLIPKDRVRITQSNMVVQFRPETWEELQIGLPSDMKKNLEKGIGTGRSCCFSRKL